MHEAASRFVQSVVEHVPIGPIVEIGGRNINGTVRPLFAAIGPYASIDLYAGRGVDLVGDVCALDPAQTARRLFGRATVTCVVCCEVLEHATQPARICQWAQRILTKGGVLILTAANPQRFTHSGIDGGPLHEGEHYRGVSAAALRRWLTGFQSVRMTTAGADIYAVAWKGRRR